MQSISQGGTRVSAVFMQEMTGDFADVGAISRQLELALIYDGKLDVRAMA